MTRIIAPLAAIVMALPAWASPEPFRYTTKCLLINGGTYEDTCTVLETRDPDGGLKTRNVFSNKFALTVKSRFDQEDKLMTWDSHNKREYPWEYSALQVKGNVFSQVMPGFYLDDLSWE